MRKNVENEKPIFIVENVRKKFENFRGIFGMASTKLNINSHLIYPKHPQEFRRAWFH